jgi:hypothetical protein
VPGHQVLDPQLLGYRLNAIRNLHAGAEPPGPTLLEDDDLDPPIALELLGDGLGRFVSHLDCTLAAGGCQGHQGDAH